MSCRRPAAALARALSLAAALAVTANSALAVVGPGDIAPNFTKPEVWTGTLRSLSDYAGKVVHLFQFGWD